MPTCTRYVRVMYAERAAARALHSQGSGRLSFTQRECAHSASFTQREFHAARVSRGASSRSAGTVARERVARFARPHHNSTVTATAAPRKRAPTPRCWHRGGTWACRRWPAVDGACARPAPSPCSGRDTFRCSWRSGLRTYDLGLGGARGGVACSVASAGLGCRGPRRAGLKPRGPTGHVSVRAPHTYCTGLDVAPVL
jgi:hypothetical protein